LNAGGGIKVEWRSTSFEDAKGASVKQSGRSVEWSGGDPQ